jgi:subtilisin family serine protease
MADRERATMATLGTLVTVAVLTATALTTPALAQGAIEGYGIRNPKLVAGRDFVAGEMIVGLARGTSAAVGDKIARTVGGTVARRLGAGNPIILVRFGDEPRAQQAVAALLALPGVRFVERNGFASIPPLPAPPTKNGRAPSASKLGGADRDATSQAVSSDPGTHYQWHHTVIRKTAALGTLATDPPTIAVIDTGVDYNHSDLKGRVIKGKNCVDDNNDPFDDQGHGTHVAGIAAATAGNGVAGEGVSHRSKVLAVKVLNYTGSGSFFDIACGMQDARTRSTSPATKVGNMSIGGPTSATIASEVDAWKAAGLVLVVAAGNENNTGDGTFNIDPDIALRVMATEENDCRTFFSNFSPGGEPGRFNIAAPGFEIMSTFPNEGYQPLNGTSMASPMVAGAAALLWGQAPGLGRQGVIDRLVDNGKSISCGFAAATRRVDVRKAITETGEAVVIGRMLDGTSGKPVASGNPSVQVLDGSTVLGADATNRGGSYEVTGDGIAGGSRKIKASRTGYITDSSARSPLTVLGSSPTGPFTDVMAQARGAGFFQATVDWKTTQPTSTAAGADTRGWDLDLLLKTPGGYVGPGPFGDLATSPFLRVFRDSFDDSEPVEALAVASSATDGTYEVVVRRFAGPAGLNLNASGAHVRLFKANSASFTKNAPACTSAQPYWHVATVAKAAGTYMITNKNLCLGSAP